MRAWGRVEAWALGAGVVSVAGLQNGRNNGPPTSVLPFAGVVAAAAGRVGGTEGWLQAEGWG